MSTSTTTIQQQPTPLLNEPTPSSLTINLVCQDRDTGKKCLFKDLKIKLLPDQNIKIIDLIEKNISLQYFLNNCMIFQPSDDDMDIMVGFYPSEEIKNKYLSHDSNTNITLKFEKIRPPSSESKKEETIQISANQNQISNNKNINNNNNNNININSNLKQNHVSPSNSLNNKIQGQGLQNNTNTEKPTGIKVPTSNQQELSSSGKVPLEQKDGSLGESDERGVNPALTQGTAASSSHLSQEDLNNNDSIIMSSHSLPIESEASSQQQIELPPSNMTEIQNQKLTQREGGALQDNTELCNNDDSNNNQEAKEKQLNRKRRATDLIDGHCSESCSQQNESKECSPCTSFTENEIPKMKKHQSAITNDPTLSEVGENNNCFSSSMNLSLNGKFPLNLFSQIGTHNSSFHAYNPLSNITNNSINSAAFNNNNGGKNAEGISGFSFMANQYAVQNNSTNSIGGGSGANSTNNMSRQSRNKERTIREAIEMVTKWRDLQEEYRQKHQVKGLQEVADELNISKKVLDYYFQELRTAEFFGFDFDGNLGNKMGVLRKYIDEQKKNHEQKNKNFKITRNLQFKYRLKDYQGSTFLSSCSQNNNNANNNNDALSSTSSSKSKEKMQIKNQAKMEQIASLLSSSVSNGQIKVEEMAIEGNGETNFNFPTNFANNSATVSTASSSSSTQKVPTTVVPNQIQEVFKNSPMFLQFMNNSSSSNNTLSNSQYSSQVANNGSCFNTNNNNTSNLNTNASLLNGLNYLSSIGNTNNGFSINPSHSDNIRKQHSQTQQNSGNIDKNVLLLELLLNQQPKQDSISLNDKSGGPTNQMESLINLFKMFSQNEDQSTEPNIPSFQRSHSAQSTATTTMMNQKFQEEEFLNKQQKLIKPQKIAVIQIRKQDE